MMSLVDVEASGIVTMKFAKSSTQSKRYLLFLRDRGRSVMKSMDQVCLGKYSLCRVLMFCGVGLESNI